MIISRRGFTGGALGLAVVSRFPSAARAQVFPGVRAALDAIRAFGEAHRAFYGLPGMTLGVTAPGGISAVMHFGHANPVTRQPVTSGTLFQIGSVTKVMTAAVIHQLAAERRLRLDGRVGALVPDVSLPDGNGITVQHLLDHTAGLPDFAPVSPPGGLWTGFKPGAHFYYSNTGYEILGRIAERLGGKPLGRMFEERLFAPLGMARSRGAIAVAERASYAQGYEPADRSVPFLRGAPLTPAAWVDFASGAGSVGSTADDMNRFLRSLAAAAQGRGGLGLEPSRATELVRHNVPAGTDGSHYGNGLRHVVEGGRSYLHHTGGMVSFSSSFHLEPASGAAAFASASISAFASYRPRLLTRFAVDALIAAMTGRPLPSPPPLETVLANPTHYVGRFSGPSGGFEIRRGNPLTIVADGQSAELQYWGGESFRTAHPRFREFTLLFERIGGAVRGASWGPSSFVREGSGAQAPASDPQVARLAGRYANPSPWWGSVAVVERGGKLWLGTETPLTRIGDNLWRAGADAWSPERVSFTDFVAGRPQTFIYSGETFRREA